MTENGIKNEAEQSETPLYDAMQPHHQMLIRMRFKGESVEAMAQATGLATSTIYNGFSAIGGFNAAFEEYRNAKRREIDARMDAAMTELDDLTIEAAKTLKELLNADYGNDRKGFAAVDANRVKVAQDILDRTLGKAAQRLDLTTKGKSLNPTNMTVPELIAYAQDLGLELTDTGNGEGDSAA